MRKPKKYSRSFWRRRLCGFVLVRVHIYEAPYHPINGQEFVCEVHDYRTRPRKAPYARDTDIRITLHPVTEHLKRFREYAKNDIDLLCCDRIAVYDALFIQDVAEDDVKHMVNPRKPIQLDA